VLSVIAAAAFALATNPTSAVSPHPCPTGSTKALIGTRSVCLREYGSCRARYQQQYRRHGYRCEAGFLSYDWAPLRRPLHIPAIATGTQCPTTTARGTIGQRGAVDAPQAKAFGSGPAFPMGLIDENEEAILELTWPVSNNDYPGWAGTKVLWTIPRYTGAVLIRGRQLDGNGELGFDLGPQWTWTILPELRLTGPEFGLHPAATFVHSSGCYAYQVDTFRRSYLIFFQARVPPP
jgi:hypothetical protein